MEFNENSWYRDRVHSYSYWTLRRFFLNKDDVGAGSPYYTHGLEKLSDKEEST